MKGQCVCPVRGAWGCGGSGQWAAPEAGGGGLDCIRVMKVHFRLSRGRWCEVSEDDFDCGQKARLLQYVV